MSVLDYESCLRACVAGLRSDGNEDAAVLYLRHPVPSPEEWQDVVRVATRYDDGEHAFVCMQVYEERLIERGLPTVLGKFVADLKGIAEEVGLPAALLPDAVQLLSMKAPAH
jgi:hypothetical protein